jgi:hypothetical protein
MLKRSILTSLIITQLGLLSAYPATVDDKISNDKEKEIKAQFSYSFNDIADSLVTVSCTTPLGRSSGSGFIATMDGKTYLFTNQHVILGADKIRFETVSGRILRPKGVQLAAKRDIARLPLDEAEGLAVTASIEQYDPIGVFGNSEGGGVATELYGLVIKSDPNKVEVSADFVSGNSGSPVLNLNKEVIGIASYVSWKTDKDEKTVTRRFCYRLTGERWRSVKWKKYNDDYGKLYQKNEAMIDSIFDAASTWYGDPFSRMSFENHKDSGLRKWSDDHNGLVNRIKRTMNKSLTQHQLDNTNKQIRKDMSDSADSLSTVCRNRARKMRLLATQKELSGFLRDSFVSLADRMEYAAEEIEKYGKELSTHDYFYFK